MAATKATKVIDLVLSFDTTSSMHSVLTAARRQLAAILRCLFGVGVDLRVGLIVHGDYGDLYETKLAQPTDSVPQLARFLSEAPNTCGLDYPECYELVLHQAATRIRWRQEPGATRLLVMLGDAVPHELESKRNKYRLDWRREARALAGMGVSVYCVDCGGVGTGFYAFAHELCAICGGAAVPYRGCRELCRLLRQLLQLGGSVASVVPALERQYHSYHCDSQRAQTVATRLSKCSEESVMHTCPYSDRGFSGRQQQQPLTAAVAKATIALPAAVVLALVRRGGVAISKTVHCAGHAMVYVVLLYLLHCMLLAACW